MIRPDIQITKTIALVAPNVDRDSENGVRWMSGSVGHKTQELMGIASSDIHDHTIEEEQKLIQRFIDTDDEIVWMVEVDDNVIGVIEVGLKISPQENGPSLSVMIGDPDFRGKGIGKKAMVAVIDYLASQGYSEVNARHISSNHASRAMNTSIGFINVGDEYVDEDGIRWQNVRKELR